MTICADRLRAENQPAPRTCSACGLGPCKFPHLVPSKGSTMALPDSVPVPDGIHPGARPAPEPEVAPMPAGHREVSPIQRIEAMAQDLRELVQTIGADKRDSDRTIDKLDVFLVYARHAARCSGSTL